MRLSGWVLFATLVSSCRKPPPPSTPTALAVEVSGCAPRRCVLDETRTVRFVTRAGDLAVQSDRGPLVAERTPIGPEVRLSVKVPEGARWISVSSGAASFRLELPAVDVVPALERARALRAEGEGEEAARVLAALPRDARALGLLARIELARGASEDAIRHFREAIALGAPDDDTFALAHALVSYPRRFDEARAAIDRLGALDENPDGRARKAYYLGEIALETGDVRSAMRSFRAAREAATRLGLRKLQRIAEQYLALALQTGGRTEEARALLDAVLADASLSACERADALTNVGWIALLGRGASLDPSAPTEQALAIVRTTCKNPQDEANLLVNLALANLQKNDAKGARARLAEARKKAPEGSIVLWALEIEGRIALAEGAPREALKSFERLASLSSAASASELAWRAAVGGGEAHEALGAREAALSAYERAETLLDGLALDVPHGDGRDGFLGDRARSARLRVDLLLRLGRTADALAAARSARTRGIAATARSGVLSSLPDAARAKWEHAMGAIRAERDALDREAADDWKLAQDQLAVALSNRKTREQRLRLAIDDALSVLGRTAKPAAPRPIAEGELLLAFHPVKKGFAVFAADDKGVDAQVVERVEPDKILLPFAARIERAKSVRVLPYGETHAIDVHALSFRGEPLVAHAPVSYSLDLPITATSPSGDSMLLVADPTGDLPAARAEAKEVAPRASQSLLGEAATSVAVRAALPLVDRFHYAGHGSVGGEAGWESVLPLANGVLSVSDVLALPRVPPLVILSACEAARTTAHGEGLGVAQAFVLAGAGGVIAANRDVPDLTAFALAHTLYGNVTPSARTDAASLLRTSQLAMRTTAPSADWAAFRALTP